MTKIKQMLCALLTVCLLLIGSTNALAAQPDTPSISVSANASIEVAPDTAVISFDVNGKGRTAAEATSASAAKMDSVKHNLLGCNILVMILQQQAIHFIQIPISRVKSPVIPPATACASSSRISASLVR